MKAICACLFTFSAFAAAAQSIDVNNINFIATSPGSSVLALITADFPGGPCSLETTGLPQQNNDTIVVNGFYCYQSSTGSCSTTDTFDLGILPAGNYIFRVMLNTSNAPAACGSAGYALHDIKFKSFTVGGATAVTENELLDKISISPNPATDKITFTLAIKDAENAEVKLHDVSGKVVRRAFFTENQGTVQATIDVRNLPENIYLYTVKTSAGAASGKIAVGGK